MVSIEAAHWRNKKCRVDKILALKTDLVIANKEENVAEQVKTLAAETDVWLTEIKNLEDALQMIQDIGLITGKRAEAAHLIDNIKSGFDQIPVLNRPLRVGYLIWRKPFMVAGGDTFIHSMLSTMGVVNVFGNLKRYPEVNLEILHENSPDLILLSSEPYPFKEKHMLEMRELLPGVKPVLVDGTFFSWYGSRLAAVPNYFGKLIMEWNQTF
jgi:ABC-type Fe3+-hydroxamate transport system substrate-binding protein